MIEVGSFIGMIHMYKSLHKEIVVTGDTLHGFSELSLLHAPKKHQCSLVTSSVTL